MSDNGPHFDNDEVRRMLTRWGTKQVLVARYSPWVNGLVEGTNKILLEILKRLCAPDLGEERWRKIESLEQLPPNWPDYFDQAIYILNNRILRALDHTPNELFFSRVINTTITDVEKALEKINVEDLERQFAYAEQQEFDGYARAVAHGVKRKAAFDQKVQKSRAGVVEFKIGELVQVLEQKYRGTHKTIKKLLPTWSGALRVKTKLENSYELETVQGKPIDGRHSARLLRKFTPPPGSALAEYEKAWKERQASEDAAKEDEVVPEEVEAEIEASAGELASAEELSDRQPSESLSSNSGFDVEAQVDDDLDEEEDVDDRPVADRVAERRRGRRQIGGGNME